MDENIIETLSNQYIVVNLGIEQYGIDIKNAENYKSSKGSEDF